jgi:murein DD-endopeptidase MepM/ murein hydrolase activator NlpD
MIRRICGGLALALASSFATATSALATDDYSLAFYDPSVQLSYGVDRDPAECRQRDWTDHLWTDCNLHYGRVYDNHTGMDYPMDLLSPLAAARGGTVVDLYEGYGTEQFGTYGNFVLLSHADGRRTLYYHLAHNGVRVSVGQSVSAGQWIADSGCSGQCYGAHLHFEMQKRRSDGTWGFVDPIFEQRFTTNPGRVPFLAAYVRENDPGTIVIQLGQTVTHWVDFRNTGGRTWRTDIALGRLILATWDPPLHTSPFRAADWPSGTIATWMDQTTAAPNAIARFTFGLRGTQVGSFDETLNLLSNSIRWFDHDALGGFHLPIIVTKIPE